MCFDGLEGVGDNEGIVCILVNDEDILTRILSYCSYMLLSIYSGVEGHDGVTCQEAAYR